MDELSIRAASEPAPPEDEYGAPRRMSPKERLHFVIIFVAAILLSIVAAIAITPFVLFGVLKRLLMRPRS